MQISTSLSTAISIAKTPEEAAAIFKAGVSQALALIIAEQLDKALQSTAPLSANPAISGWQDHIGGAHLDLCWQRPTISSVLPSLVTAFAPYPTAKPAALGASISIGISVSASF